MKLCSMTHFDLDGVGSKIFADKIFGPISGQETIYNKCSGYGKIDQNVQHMIDKGFDSIVITDLNFTVEQMQVVVDNFDNVFFYDHHDGSDEVVEKFKDHPNMKQCIWTKEMSATGIMFKEYIKYLKLQHDSTPSMEEAELAMLCDVYDVWRQEHKLFTKAFKLNQLFWRYSFWDFEKKFVDGFEGFSAEESEFLEQQEFSIREQLEEVPLEEHGDTCMTIMVSDGSQLNWVGLVHPEMEVLFIIMHDSINDEYKQSVRVKNRPTINVNDILRSQENNNDMIVSAGGHAAAGGISFVKGTTPQEILKYNKETLSVLMTDLPW